jgi:hypothetical protein
MLGSTIARIIPFVFVVIVTVEQVLYRERLTSPFESEGFERVTAVCSKPRPKLQQGTHRQL